MSKIYSVCAIISEAAKNNGGEVFNILDDDSGGSQTFSVALSPSGNANATHYGAYFYEMDAVLYDKLKNASVSEFKAYVDAESTRKQRTYSGSVTQFKNNLVIENRGDFWSFVEAQGLKPINSA